MQRSTLSTVYSKDCISLALLITRNTSLLLSLCPTNGSVNLCQLITGSLVLVRGGGGPLAYSSFNSLYELFVEWEDGEYICRGEEYPLRGHVWGVAGEDASLLHAEGTSPPRCLHRSWRDLLLDIFSLLSTKLFLRKQHF